MAFGLKCPAMCFMNRLSLSTILKELATFLSFTIHWKGGMLVAFDAYYIWRHCHLWKSVIFGMWLVGCFKKNKNCMGYGFCWWVFCGLLFLEVWYVVCCWFILWLVVNMDNFGRQQMQDRYHSYSLKEGSWFFCCYLLLKRRMLSIT